MKITLSNDPKDEGEEGIVYVPLSLFASIVATLHERELLPKAQVLPTQHALDAATPAPKCTTASLCPVYNVWHAKPRRR